MPLREIPRTIVAVFGSGSGVGRSRMARVLWHSGRWPGASLPPRRIALITAPGYRSLTPSRHELLMYKRTPRTLTLRTVRDAPSPDLVPHRPPGTPHRTPVGAPRHTPVRHPLAHAGPTLPAARRSALPLTARPSVAAPPRAAPSPTRRRVHAPPAATRRRSPPARPPPPGCPPPAPPRPPGCAGCATPRCTAPPAPPRAPPPPRRRARPR